MTHALKTPNSTKALGRALFQVREEHGELLQSLAVRSCVLEVRSWSDNKVSVNPYQATVILHSDKKGQGLQAQLSSSEVQILAEEEADFNWQLSQGRVPTVLSMQTAAAIRSQRQGWGKGSLLP